jgi:hypothetical protein
MRVLAILWLQIYKLAQLFIHSFHTTVVLNPYCDLIGRGFEVGYVPAETLGEISLLCDQINTPDF